jgi:two-component system, chemotaxis family, sensor kinase CheA
MAVERESQDARALRRLETFRKVAAERLGRLSRGWIDIERDGPGSPACSLFLREIHTLKGESGLTGFGSVNRLCHRLEDLMETVVRAGGRPPGSTGDLVMRGLELAGLAVQRAPETESAEITAFLAGDSAAPSPPLAETKGPVTESAPAPAAVPMAAHAGRLDATKLDGLRDLVAELLLTRVRLQRSASELRGAKEAGNELRRAARGLPEAVARELGHLAETLSSLEGRLRDEAHQVARLVTELDDATRELRMVPIGSLLERYPVAVRTLARKLDKQVRLRTVGEATEVDREVLERLDEPLLHLVQNAVDHGIEPAARRTLAGKPPEATITLKSWLAGQILHVDVSDDGAGIDLVEVRARALALGLIEPAAAAQMTKGQMARTIFSAGFSTRSQVSETSGRGVGLNVVLSAVEGLGGQVTVETTFGKGTTFHLQVPVTVAITAAVLFKVGDARYAIPAAAVETIVEGNELSMVDSVDGRAFRHGGRVIPLVSLEAVLGEPNRSDRRGGRSSRLIIVKSGADQVAMSGSQDHVEREVVLKPTGKFFERQRLVSAAVHLEDGSLALVLKPAELVFSGRDQRNLPSDGPSSETAVPLRTGFGKTVLVADDSPVVRDLIADALRAHGIRVIEACDGQEALERLQAHPGIDLVVTDFEMPRLDGPGLIRALRARPGARRIPAVVVSMRGSDADKRAALEVGADAYLVKSDFSHAGLWTMIARFLG